MTRLLIIDDDHSLFALLDDYLGNFGFECAHAASAEAGLERLAGGGWDAVVLDLMLPGMNGHEVLRRIRGGGSPQAAIPVLMLSAKGEEDDKVEGLELGADDYLGKPFGARELVARLRTLLRRNEARPAGPGILILGDIVLDRAAMRVAIGERRCELTAAEFRLLEVLGESPGGVVRREALYEKVIGHRQFPQDRSLDMLISRLRRKLGPGADGGERIRAARGEGYMLLLAGAAS